MKHEDGGLRIMRGRGKALLATAVLGGLSLSLPEAALAAAGESEAAGIGSLFWPTVNFILYAGVITYGYRRLGRPVLRDRSIQVASHMERAREQLDTANAELARLQNQLAGIEEEKAEILARFEQEGQNMAATIIANAHKSADGIRSDLRRRIDNELAKARADIRTEVVQAAAHEARERLRRELSNEDDRRLRQEAVRSLIS